MRRELEDLRGCRVELTKRRQGESPREGTEAGPAKSEARKDFSGRKAGGLRCSWDLSCLRSAGVFPTTSSQQRSGCTGKGEGRQRKARDAKGHGWTKAGPTSWCPPRSPRNNPGRCRAPAQDMNSRPAEGTTPSCSLRHALTRPQR